MNWSKYLQLKDRRLLRSVITNLKLHGARRRCGESPSQSTQSAHACTSSRALRCDWSRPSGIALSVILVTRGLQHWGRPAFPRLIQARISLIDIRRGDTVSVYCDGGGKEPLAALNVSKLTRPDVIFTVEWDAKPIHPIRLACYVTVWEATPILYKSCFPSTVFSFVLRQLSHFSGE